MDVLLTMVAWFVARRMLAKRRRWMRTQGAALEAWYEREACEANRVSVGVTKPAKTVYLVAEYPGTLEDIVGAAAWLFGPNWRDSAWARTSFIEAATPPLTGWRVLNGCDGGIWNAPHAALPKELRYL